jgi:cyclopropane fatty-acyl-phospholipid synthase-like methyltransferase
MALLNTISNMLERAIPLRYIRIAGNKFFDKINGLNTDGNVSLKELGLDDTDRVHYAPSSWLTIPRIAEVIPFSKEDVFIDFGSGKGRQVILAARHFPFKRVEGVELSSALNEIASANVKRSRRSPKCKNIKLITSDVLAYEIPLDMTIAYLYSPFTGEVFQSFINRIGDSFSKRENKRLWVVLQRPTFGLDEEELTRFQRPEDFLRSTTWLRHVNTIGFSSPHWATEISIYQCIDN